MALSGRIVRALRWMAFGLAAVFAAGAVFAAVVMPYRLWDSLAFGSWSRSIAESGDLWANTPALYLQRPFFYVSQGLAWRLLGDHMWIGRLLSLSFTFLLAGSVWILAGRLTSNRDVRALAQPLSVCLVLASSVVATYAAAGMSDVPVAALVALTGAALWTLRPSPPGVALVAAAAAAAVLAKPTALLAFVGLVPAAFLLRGRRAAGGVGGLVAGVLAALLYDRWQASRLGDSLSDFVTAGNDAFWRARGAAARWDAVARAEWLGAGLRQLVVYGLVYAAVRACGGRPRLALGVAGATAIAWSVVGPLVADGSLGYPLADSVIGTVAWFALAAAMVVAPFVATTDPIGRRTYAGLLVWLTPTAVAWAWQRADEVRHLAPAWAPLVLLTACALVPLSLALARLRPVAALIPAAALGILVVANLPSIDGLGREGWRGLLDLGPSGWGSSAAIENYAYGPFSYELDLARAQADGSGKVVSSNGRLAYFFPGRFDFRYARTCSELAGASFFSYLRSGESAEFAQQAGQPLDPLGWMQCKRPHLELVGEQPGIYAAFAVGNPPARAPTPGDCHISSTPGELSDAVFGDGLSYAAAKSLVSRVLAVGFQGSRIERTGCSTFRVVVTGIPASKKVRKEFRAEVESVGFRVTFVPAVRYPEVPADVTAVR